MAAEHLTSAWPVKASSICALSAPVCAHCATNCFCERFAISRVTTIDSGTVTSAISASSGEIQNIIASTPMTVSSEVSSWLIVCCRRLRDVVDVVGDAAEQLAARLGVEVAQRQAVQLVLDVGAQRSDRALHDAVEHVGLQPGEHARRRRRAASDEQQHVAESAVKSMPWPGHDVHCPSRSAKLSSPRGPGVAIGLLAG